MYKLSYFIGVIFAAIGFHKLWFYKNYESTFLMDENVNSYVGGDAYNYIINAGKANAYFTLALICVVIGSIALFLEKLKEHQQFLEYINKTNNHSIEKILNDTKVSIATSLDNTTKENGAITEDTI